MEQYTFTLEEMVIIREATREYIFFLRESSKKDGHTTDKRQRNIQVARNLFEQFRDAVICAK